MTYVVYHGAMILLLATTMPLLARLARAHPHKGGAMPIAITALSRPSGWNGRRRTRGRQQRLILFARMRARRDGTFSCVPSCDPARLSSPTGTRPSDAPREGHAAASLSMRLVTGVRPCTAGHRRCWSGWPRRSLDRLGTEEGGQGTLFRLVGSSVLLCVAGCRPC